MIDLNEMLIFVRVVEQQSLTGAGRVLGLPKSTVSRKLSSLEDRLGVRLLQRTTRKMHLTPEGETYYARCSHIVAQIEEAEQSVISAVDKPRGTLRISAPRIFVEYFLSDLIHIYLQQYPEVRVELLLNERIVDLVEENYDLAIRVGTLRDSSLIARKLGPVPGFCCASPAYLKARGVPQTPDDLSQHDCILVGSRIDNVSWTFQEPDTQKMRNTSVHGRLLVNHLPLAYKAVLRGDGIARLPSFLCADDLRAGKLRSVLEDWLPKPGSIYAVYPSNRHLPAKVRSFLDLLIEEVTPPPWLPTPL